MTPKNLYKNNCYHACHVDTDTNWVGPHRVSLNTPNERCTCQGSPQKTRGSDHRPWPNPPTMSTQCLARPPSWIPTRPPAWTDARFFGRLTAWLPASPSTWPPSTFTSAPPSIWIFLVLLCSWLLQWCEELWCGCQQHGGGHAYALDLGFEVVG